MSAFGFDFGTTNSAIAIATGSGPPRVTPTFRSVLYFDPDERGADRRPRAFTGPEAIEHYLENEGGGRLIQSLKSYLGSRQFRATNIFGHNYTLEELIAVLVRGLLARAAAVLGPLPSRAVVGRPVRFAGDDEDQAMAESRLRSALALAGLTDVTFEYEPVAAAYHYESGLDHDELILVADFGGGTSDFCLARVGPGVRARGRSAEDIVGTEGVAVAGDAFDARIVRHVVAPALGRGTTYDTHGQAMPVPPWIYSHLQKWHHLSFLKSRSTMKLLGDIHQGSSDPARIDALLHLIDSDLGYHLYRSVERSKIALSSAPATDFTFHDDPIAIGAHIPRATFDTWIAPETTAIAEAVDRLLARTHVPASAVDRVFMTGGSSLVPAVRALFATRFTEARLSGGDELLSVASGLAGSLH